MTPNEKDAHAVAHAATHRLRWTRDRTQRLYAAFKVDYDEAQTKFQDAYEGLYETELAKLESSDDE